ncbi:PepSY domain-containing protein [Phreatobacter cathodiphilus]|uniref:PepSY domain-containing protein n=1 Tax=Phreatobacter cathodiphilus TaxID=1868589 RepID=UPI001FEC87CA|nr:PepSY domain-containing protein [Phreatobacter cathodiphilus]
MPAFHRRVMLAATLALTIAAVPLAAARADDRPVTPQERVQIENSLRQAGFTRWGDIEFDDGHFDVDDAIAADGGKYDLELSSVDFSIIKRERDD